MLSASLLQGCLTNGPLQALAGPLAASALASVRNRLLPLLSSASRAQHSMVQEQEGLAEHVHEDPRLAKIEAVRKKV
jgi:hypothetical protein